MLNQKQKRLIQEINNSKHKDQLHQIENEWLKYFERHFSDEDNIPCEMSLNMLSLIHKKATIKGNKLPWE